MTRRVFVGDQPYEIDASTDPWTVKVVKHRRRYRTYRPGEETYLAALQAQGKKWLAAVRQYQATATEPIYPKEGTQ